MRNLFLAIGLVILLVIIMLQGRTQTGPPVPPAAQQPEPQAIPEPVTRPADQLLVAAVNADGASAWSAYRELKQIAHCPYLDDSPETPVGLLVAAYGQQSNDSERVRETIRLMLNQGCDIDQYSAAGLTPLHNAVLFRQPELLRFLLEQGADPLLRVIPIPGRELGRGIAHLDAYGMTLVLRDKNPDDPAISEILELLKPAA